MCKFIFIVSLFLSTTTFAGMKEIYTDTTDAVNAYFEARQMDVVSIENYGLMSIDGTDGDLGVRTDVTVKGAGTSAVPSLYHCLTYFAPGAATVRGPQFNVVDTDCNFIR